jgi:hypothetical protein
MKGRKVESDPLLSTANADISWWKEARVHALLAGPIAVQTCSQQVGLLVAGLSFIIRLPSKIKPLPPFSSSRLDSFNHQPTSPWPSPT